VGLKVLQYPTYFPDLNRRYHDLIPKAKQQFCGERFAVMEEILRAFRQEVAQRSMSGDADDDSRLSNRWQQTADKPRYNSEGC
jgi:hypothetical protein